ncbi:hypothetical protein [Tsukamurella tyrosinosolvens]|uniref:hypothetical protein n=1 Tax=Tsukamurella tyrosinosolvens TaxID=57704 RepID=UPI00125F3138|nr:hypothetical protein [Tsukamurella tyrosinosolvens]
MGMMEEAHERRRVELEQLHAQRARWASKELEQWQKVEDAVAEFVAAATEHGRRPNSFGRWRVYIDGEPFTQNWTRITISQDGSWRITRRWLEPYTITTVTNYKKRRYRQRNEVLATSRERGKYDGGKLRVRHALVGWLSRA